MSLTAAYYRLIVDIPPVGNAALPGQGGAKASVIFGWAMAIVGIVAFLALIAAAISWMVAKQQHGSTDGPEKAVKVMGAIILAVSAGAIVNVMIA